MWLLRLLCALVLGAILTAGLWPFFPPKNQVSWAPDRNGLRLGERGIIYASGLRPRPSPAETDSCALEIWLQPEAAVFGFLAEFAGSNNYFSLLQEGFALRLILHNQTNLGGPEYRRWVKNVLRPGEPVLIAISSNGKTTNVFVDGVLTQSIDFPLVARNLYGEFRSRGWKGQLFGIATYKGTLSPADVSRHREAWTSNGRPEPPPSAEALAIYLFDERGGRVIHNKAGWGPDLYIPERYSNPDRVLLGAGLPHLWEWRDILLNIAGFVPLGFLFYAYFSSERSPTFPALVTVLTGFAISLGIEVSQSFLPDRISDVGDIVSNTLGTVAGVLLYRILRGSSAVARLGWRGASARIAPQASDTRPR